MLIAAVCVRVLVIVAYSPAFWWGDTWDYIDGSRSLRPHYVHQLGYSIYLSVFPQAEGTLGLAVAIQNLLGVEMAVLCYAFLVRKGLPRWVSALVTAPILLDGQLIALEHFVLSDSLFIALLMTGIVLLFWNERPGIVLSLVGAGFLAAATVTRVIGLPVVVLLAIFFVIRRNGWKPTVAFVCAAALPLIGYAVLYREVHGVYGFTKYQGGFLYGRTATFADCASLKADERLMRLCPPEPVHQRPHQESFLWGERRAIPPGGDPSIGQEFALTVITQQPGRYLSVVGADLWHLFDPFWTPDRQTSCYRLVYELPADPGAPSPHPPGARCGDAELVAGWSGKRQVIQDSRQSGVTEFLHAYSVYVRVPPLLWLVVIGFTVLVFVFRRTWMSGLGLTLCASGTGMIVAATATNMHEPRFLMVTMPLLAMGAGLAATALTASGRPRGTLPPPSAE